MRHGVSMDVSLNFHPLPKSQSDLRLTFNWRYYESESVMPPAAYEHVHGGFTLLTVDNGDSATFSGQRNPHDHPGFNLPLTGHKYGISFVIKVKSHCMLLDDSIYWRTFVSQEKIIKAFEARDKNTNVLQFEGSCPDVPHVQAQSTLNLIYEKEGTNFCVKGASIDIPVDYYTKWYEANCAEHVRWLADCAEKQQQEQEEDHQRKRKRQKQRRYHYTTTELQPQQNVHDDDKL